ncbi:MAG: hypothetical protein EOO04_08025, partial [Chitinophagaceae bacterium]
MSAVSKPVRSFIDETGADKIISEIEAGIRAQNNGIRPHYSDLIQNIDGQELEYVNYVQEGGGVLGIGLIGYTYALEKMGFRFARLAGTSAGAVTTIMLAAVDKKNYPDEKLELQSEIMLRELLRYDLWQLVDGHWLAKRLIRIFINYRFGTRLLKILIGAAIVIPVIYALYQVIRHFANKSGQWVSTTFFDHAFSAVALLSLATLVILISIFFYFRVRFSRAGFGVNTGKNFHAWITGILARNNVHTMDDLRKVMQSRLDGLEMRPGRAAMKIPGDDLVIPSPLLTLVASDITAQTKVEFPLMSKHYWSEPEKVNPADFVRASMSIPLFFEPFRVSVPDVVQQHSKLQQRRFESVLVQWQLTSAND